MRLALRLGLVAALSGTGVRAEVPAPGARPPVAEVTFEKDIAPLLTPRCQPCHFSGGVMYAKLPFDRASTIRQLGAKLFTRIHNEEQRAVIRRFLATEPTDKPSPAPPLQKSRTPS